MRVWASTLLYVKIGQKLCVELVWKAELDKNPWDIHVSEEIIFGLTSASAAEWFLCFVFLQEKNH